MTEKESIIPSFSIEYKATDSVITYADIGPTNVSVLVKYDIFFVRGTYEAFFIIPN